MRNGIRNSALHPMESRATATSQMPFQLSVGVIHAGELGIPHRTVRVGAEDKAAAPVVEAVDEQHDVVVRLEIGIPAELRRPDPVDIRVIGVHTHVQGIRVSCDLYYGALGARRSLLGTR